MAYGLKRKAVNYNGAALGVIIAITLSLANHAFLACLATFFFSSSRVTKFRSQLKRKIETDFKGGKHIILIKYLLDEIGLLWSIKLLLLLLIAFV